MLTTIRNKASGLISLILIGAICLSFALWGIQSYFEGANQVDVASVNGEEISYDYFQSQLSARQQQIREVFQDQLPSGYFETEQFKRQTIDQIIDSVIIKQITDKNRYTLNDAALTKSITANPAFQSDGQFDDERYRRLLASNSWSVKAYEETQRKQVAFEEIVKAVNDSVVIDDTELNRLLELRNQKRLADYFIIEQDDFTVQVTDAQIQQHYDENQILYKTVDEIKVDYVELSAQDLIDETIPTKEEIAQYFEDNKSEFSTPEVRKASHILIKPENDEEQSNTQALKQVNELIAKLEEGADFAELAKTFSADKGSANNGGDLGVITRGVMVKPFEDAVFSLQPGQLSEPVKSQFGYHLIKLTELTPEQTPALEEVEERLVNEYKNNHAIEEFTNQAEVFKNLVFENPEDLNQVADDLGLEVKQSDWFSRGSTTGIAADPKIREVAFSATVIEDGLNGDVIELADNKLVALRKADFKPAAVKPLDEVKENISTLLASQLSLQRAVDKGAEILTKLDETSWQAVVDEGNFKVTALAQTSSAAKPGVEASISKAVFEQAMPEPDKPIYGGVSLPQGYAVYHFYAIEAPDKNAIEQIPAPEREQLRASLTARFGAENSQNLLKTFRDSADIRLFQENW